MLALEKPLMVFTQSVEYTTEDLDEYTMEDLDVQTSRRSLKAAHASTPIIQ